MYIWTIEAEEQWTYHEKDEWDYTGELTFAAKTFEQALDKARRYLTVGRKYKDNEGKMQEVRAVRFTYVKREQEITA